MITKTKSEGVRKRDEMNLSVVIPVYNDRAGLERCLTALCAQTCDRKQFEIIVVDNGSTDGSKEIAYAYQARFPSLIRIVRERTVKSSYAARNRGIEAARGEIVVFLDADCRPAADWLEQGLVRFRDRSIDLVAGSIAFEFSTSRPSVWEIYDSLVHMQQAELVRRGQAATANLFVRRLIFDSVGLFPANLISGGDTAWTSRATKHGARLVYAEEAIVHHPARDRRLLLEKQIRIGRGQPMSWRRRGWSWGRISRVILSDFFYPVVFYWRLIRRAVGLPAKGVGQKIKLRDWLFLGLVACTAKLHMNYGRIKSLLDGWWRL